MIDIEQKYKELYQSYGGKKLRLVFYKEDYRALYPSETLYPSESLYPSEVGEDAVDFEITDDMISAESMTNTESISSAEDLDFGACESSAVEITVSGLSQNIAGREFAIMEDFGDYHMVRGLYTVESTPKQEDKDTRKIIAYDRMKRFDEDVSSWYNMLTFPLTLQQFRESLCEFVGVPVINASLVNDGIQITKTIQPTVLSGRDMLKYICQINGAFGNITKNGELRFITIPKTDDITSTIDIYQTAESEEYMVPDIDTVQIREEEGDIGGTSVGEGLNMYIIEGNPLVYGKTTAELIEIANAVKTVIGGISYQPATISTNGAPWIEVGDRISLQTDDGVINTIITKRVMTGIQGSMDSYESSGTQNLNQSFSIETTILQLQGKTAILERTVSSVSNTLTDLEKSTNSKFQQTADSITAEVARATGAESSLSSRVQQNADSISLKVSKGDVTSQLMIEQDKIHFDTGRFSWSATNSSMTADGTLTVNSGLFKGSIDVGNGQFTVDSSGKVVAKSIQIGSTSSTNTGYFSTLIASSHTCDNLIVQDAANINEITAGYIECNSSIKCSMIYSSAAGQWWSDKRLKHDINDIPDKMAYDIIKNLRPVEYKMNDGGYPGIGFIAQDVLQICEENHIDLPLYGSHDGFYTIPYQNYIALLVGAMHYIIKNEVARE